MAPPLKIFIPTWDNLTAASVPTITVTGASDGFLSASNQRQELNAAMQSASALAGMIAAKNPSNVYLASVAVTVSVQAMGSALAILIDDINAANSNNWQYTDIRRVSSDVVQIIGDAATAIGAISQYLGAPALSRAITIAGAGLTVGGMAISPDSVVANAASNITSSAISSISDYVDSVLNSIESQINAISNWITSQNSSASGAWNSVQNSFYNNLNAVSNILDHVGSTSSVFASDANSMLSSFTGLKNAFANFVNTSGTDITGATVTISNNAVAITTTDTSFSGINGNITYNSTNNSIGLSNSSISEVASMSNNGLIQNTKSYNTNGSTQYTKTITTQTNGQYKTDISAKGSIVSVNNSPTNVSVDNSGNVKIALTPEAGSGLTRTVDVSSSGVSVNVGGSVRIAGGAGANVGTDSSGNISVTSAPVGGWTQTTTLNQSGVTTQTFAAQDANGNPINISDIFAPMVAPVVNQITIAGSTFNNGVGQSFQNFVNSKINTLELNTTTSLQTATQNAFVAVQNFITNGSVIPPSSITGILPSSIQSVLTPFANMVSSGFDFSNDIIQLYNAGIAYAQPTIITGQITVVFRNGFADAPPNNTPAYNLPAGAGGSWGNPLSQFDPLVLSTTRQGINLISLSQSTVKFDYSGSGLKQQTGWIGDDTGFLVLLNSGTDVKVGNLLTFASLAGLDSNSDGKITSADTNFSKLKVWVDSNRDGVSNSSELLTLAQLGITAVNRTYNSITESVGGNVITATGTVTYSDGTSGAIDDVTFATLTKQGTLPLFGQSPTALTFMQKVLSGLPAKAEGMAIADSKALSDAIKSNVKIDVALAADMVTTKTFSAKQMLDPSTINITTGNIANSIFQANDASGKLQLYVSNGTAAGTTQITSIAGGISAVSKFCTLGATGKYLFSATVGGVAASEQLWVTDGTVAGTKQLTSVANSTGLKLGYLAGNSFVAVGTSNNVLFTGNDANNKTQLWVSDGTVAGTKQLTTIAGGLSPWNFVPLANGTEMFAGKASDGTYQIWVTDGTSVGTKQITNISAGGALGLNPQGIKVLGNTGTELFVGNAANGSQQLWITDGTANGTTQLSNIGGAGNAIGNFVILGTTGKEVFSATNSGISQLWATDSTTSGTIQLTNVTAGTKGLDPSNFIALGSEKELFQGVGVNGLNQLWGTDGTATGTQQLTNIGGTGLNPTNFVELGGGKELFRGVGSNGKVQLWATDGTTAGTFQITNYTSASQLPSIFTTSSGKGLFSSIGTNGTTQLWVTDGTSAGTLQLSSISGINGLSPRRFIELGNTGKILFDGYAADGVRHMWVTDGTGAGTIQLSSSTFPVGFIYLGNNKEIFIASDANSKSQMFVTDGTVSGTQQLTNIAGGMVTGQSIAIDGGKILFSGLDIATNRYNLWVTDGTVAGTNQITNLGAGSGLVVDSFAGFVKMANSGKVLFEATLDNGPLQIWSTDGTSAGTTALATTSGSTIGISPLGATGKYVVQNLNSSITTYVTDGTVAGTQLWNNVFGSSATGFILPTISNTTPSAVRQATVSVNSALESTNIAAQYVQLAADAQTDSEAAALIANTENALVGSASDIAAWQAASKTEGAWHTAFASLASATVSLQNASTSINSSQAAVNSLMNYMSGGSQFLTSDDAREAYDTANEQATSAQSLAVGNAAFQSLLVAAAQAWGAVKTTILLNGNNFTATGGDLVITASGTETINDAQSASKYAILQGSNVQISNFKAGINGSILDFLSQTTNAVITQVANGTQITVGSATVTLLDVNVTSLSLYDNIAGVQNVAINGSGVSANLLSGRDFIDDGTTHINSVSFGTGDNQTLIGGNGYVIYNFAAGDGVNFIRNGVSTNNGPTGELNFGAGISGNSLIFSKSSNDLNIKISGSTSEVTIKDWFTNSYSQIYSIKAADGTNINSGVSGSLVFNNAASGTSKVELFAPANDIATEYISYTGLDGTGNITEILINWASSGSQRQVLVGLPAGLSKAIYDYLGADASGAIVSSTLYGTSSADNITGGTSNDTIEGFAGADTINGGTGNDTASYASSTSLVNVNLTRTGVQFGGHATDDVLSNIENIIGSASNDILTGDANNNIIAGGFGADTINGGSGVDTASYSGSSAGVNVNLNLTTAQSGGDAQGDILSNMENLIGSGFDDNLIALATGSIIEGGAGADAINGGAGIDTASYASSKSGVNIDLNLSTAQSVGDAQGDILTGIENILGSSFDDVVASSVIANNINGGNGIDTVSYDSSSAGVNVNLNISTAQSGGYAQGDILSNVENVNGSLYDDTLTGNSIANILFGDAGNDTIIGGTGADIINGGAGNDTVSYADSASLVNVNLTRTGVQFGGSATDDVLSNIENIIGSNSNDTLTGDDLIGNILKGLGGKDTLTGKAGADVFKYSATTDSGITSTTRDLITDFVKGTDKVDLADFAGTFVFRGTGAFTGTAHEVNYSQVGGNTIIGIDADGNGTLDSQIELAGLHALAASDFLL